MSGPMVSVIIPAYNQASYVATAIRSVLQQSYSDWELFVIDDGSTDSTAQVVAKFDDDRMHYVYQANKGLPGARNTGIKMSTGQYIAFLDADDWYHPSKLELQVAHLDHCPNVGLSFASRVEVNRDGNPLWLFRSPPTVSLKELVLGFPFTINDLLIHRDWIIRVGGFDESLVIHGEDRDFYLRLALGGCQFARIDDFLSYRRLYQDRIFRNIPARLALMLDTLNETFADPRCPADAISVRDLALANVYLSWAYHELVQCETLNGQRHLEEAVRLNPSLLKNEGEALLRILIWASIRDGGDHETPIRTFFTQLPPSLDWLFGFCDYVIGRGYLDRGARAALWGQLATADEYFSRAVAFPSSFDNHLARYLTDQLLSFEQAFGSDRTKHAFKDLTASLSRMPSRGAFDSLHDSLAPTEFFALGHLTACYLINCAFRDFSDGKYERVPMAVLRSIIHEPAFAANRGVVSIFLRSLVSAISPRLRTRPV